MISLLADLMAGRHSSTTLAIASRDAESDLFPSYLHLHSRQTRLKLMDPFAKGTFARAEAARVLEDGANAVAVERADARMDNFMMDLLDIFFMICDDVVFLPSGSIDRGIRHTTGMMCSHLFSYP